MFLGPIPAEIQKVTVFSAGLAGSAQEPEAGAALIKFSRPRRPRRSLGTAAWNPADPARKNDRFSEQAQPKRWIPQRSVLSSYAMLAR